LSHLSEVEREVIRLRYGLDDGVEMSLRAVGKHFGKSYEWVAKVQKAALAKMRQHAT
jgi:DNA-directed RNA polymerase sigma subunit (sigma70/sigma32)